MKIALHGTLTRASGFRLRTDLEVETDGVVALVGRSGAGKSTLLRVIGGFEAERGIAVEVDGERWDGLPPHRRPVATVFQRPRLFEHLTVRGNLAFATRHRERAGAFLEADAVIDFLDLEALLEQRPAALSGGQQQRVALGRALLSPARLWLLDEPLAALDPAARAEIAPYLSNLCRTHRVPIVYVTHTITEVVQLAEQVLVVADGAVSRIDSLEAFSTSFSNPLLQDDEAGAIVACAFERYHAADGLSELRFGDVPFWVRGDLSTTPSPVNIHVPARDVSLAVDPVGRASILNRVPGVIEALHHGRDSVLVRLRCGDQHLLSRVTELSVRSLDLREGTPVEALIKSVALRTLDD